MKVHFTFFIKYVKWIRITYYNSRSLTQRSFWREYQQHEIDLV